MTAEAEGAQVVEIALASSFGYGQNVIGVPEAFPAAAARAPLLQQASAIRAAGTPKLAKHSDRIDTADGTDALVPQIHLLAQVRGLRAELPFVHAIRRAKGEAAARNFQRTPAAEAAAMGAAGDGFSVDPAAGHGPHSAHILFIAQGAGRAPQPPRVRHPGNPIRYGEASDAMAGDGSSILQRQRHLIGKESCC